VDGGQDFDCVITLPDPVATKRSADHSFRPTTVIDRSISRSWNRTPGFTLSSARSLFELIGSGVRPRSSMIAGGHEVERSADRRSIALTDRGLLNVRRAIAIGTQMKVPQYRPQMN